MALNASGGQPFGKGFSMIVGGRHFMIQLLQILIWIFL
ncbi:hypothetical protein Mgra_00004372 [Meloidogyne graminicola]|uniref:Uncharacterized protein n=1 Tax=Meloidogyne graminicola TaxID=189291 RepID=A0A8S9ZRS8_9BILA|nr:hypothetical protein Mgra_00004372 [Meloidogyne graminicola]